MMRAYQGNHFLLQNTSVASCNYFALQPIADTLCSNNNYLTSTNSIFRTRKRLP